MGRYLVAAALAVALVGCAADARPGDGARERRRRPIGTAHAA